MDRLLVTDRSTDMRRVRPPSTPRPGLLAPVGRLRILILSLVLSMGSGFLILSEPTEAYAATLPPGFQETIVFSGLTNPTAVRFASDGRVFVAEKGGVIKVFDSLQDASPDTFADLNVNVHNYWDRGLLGLALDPDFPAKPYVYVLYTYDHELGSTAPAPRWGKPGVYSDPCPNPPGATANGCVVSGRLSRLRADGNAMTGAEKVLVEDWCQQYPSHSVGSVEFGRDGALYASGGDGASFSFVDYGQKGAPLNPCGDPPGGAGTALTPPTAEGGALRSQDLRTAGDRVTLDGSVIRVDPATGKALPTNPLAGAVDENAQRIIAYGLRNPFRLTARPDTDEIWVADVGWGGWEEINVLSVGGAVPKNFGWPCYEGAGRQSGYESANLNICEDLYATPGAVTAPHHTYAHDNRVVSGETCPTGSSSIAGLQFGSSGDQSSYPAEYDGALFFADYSRDCIWVMPKGAGGKPSPGLVKTFVSGAANPVNLQIGPGGDLFYVDFTGGTIRRIQYTSANQDPVAVAKATPTTGAAPLTVTFNGTGSHDPDPGDVLSYAWDLDGDGAFDDSTAAQPTHTYTSKGDYTASLRVADNHGATATDSVTISVGNTAPTAVIDIPNAGTAWKVGDVIKFSGSATDAEDGNLPPSALSWELIVQHCPSNCHSHPVQTFPKVANGSFSAPDHEYPSHLELRLTATDSGGLSNTKTVRLDPKTVSLTFQTDPGGLSLTVGSSTAVAPFTRSVIVGSTNSISAPTPQAKDGANYRFVSWSDGGAQTHNLTAPPAATTYSALLEPAPSPTETEVVRLAGQDRYATAAAISGVHTPGAGTVFVATGADYPDALAVAARAGSLGAPVLLTREATLPNATRQELIRLAPKRVVVVGGESAISQAVLNLIDDATGPAPITRWAGADRYATAARVAADFGSSNIVYVATGENYPDALAGAARAGALDGPVLLVRTDEVPTATRTALSSLNPVEIRVLGGATAISDDVLTALGAYTRAERVGGADRYATAALVAADLASASSVYVSSGQNWPDALAGAARAGMEEFPVLLTRPGAIPTVTWSELERLNPDTVYILGGPSAVSLSVEQTLSTLR